VSNGFSASVVGKVVLEAVVVVVAAAAFGFGANELSPRGLKLARNYFPSGTDQAVATSRISAPIVPTNSAASSNITQTSPTDPVDERLKDKGLQPISRARTLELFHDPRYREGPIVFVDARNQEHYEVGHIPGAFPLDPYHPEQQMTGVLTACQAADQVVVYCTGGECEDADTTAILLREAGVPNQKLFVYGGGYEDWAERRLPIERGAKNSGDISGQTK
jgi:rhodanese-related sulfurtransferase